MASPKCVASILEMLSAMFSKDVAFLTDDQVSLRAKTYAENLCDIGDEALLMATRKWIATGGDSFPTVKQLRGAATGFAVAAEERPSADGAWRLACQYAQHEIGRRVCEFEVRNGVLYEIAPLAVHPVIKQVADAIGIERIFERKFDEEGTLYAQFRNAYEARCKQADELSGMHPAVRGYIEGLSAEMRARLPAPKPVPADYQPPVRDELRDRELAIESEMDGQTRQVRRELRRAEPVRMDDGFMQAFLQRALQGGAK